MDLTLIRSPVPAPADETWLMSGTVTLRGVHVGFGAQAVLAGVDLVVGPGDRVGVVAPNGVGKSTLLRVIAGELPPESGVVVRAPASAAVVRLEQEPGGRPEDSLHEHLARRTGVAAAQATLEASTLALAAGEPGSDDAYATALDAWLALGGADLDERAAALTAELRLPPDLLARGATALSGGQKARLALAAVLLARPDILLLDEPTNDLDDDGLARLEAHVRATPAGVVLVSHDRAFLAATVDRIVELDEFTHGSREFRGGYQSYVDERAAARRRATSARDDYEAQRGRLVDAARRQREWARAGAQRAANPRNALDGDKFIRHGRIEGAQRLGAGAARSDRAVERLDAEAPDVVREPWQLRLSIAQAPRAGDVVAALRDAVVARGDVTLGPFELSLAWAERLRITGPNGSGKSTLVDALLGRLPLRAGTRYVGPSVVFGELDQSRRAFATDEAVVDVVRHAAGLADLAATRTLLAKFRLAGDVALRAARGLSPGERTRAALALLQARGVNALVLDEPTNHLDLEAIEQLEAALAEFTGTLLLVTHDRRLAEAVRVDRTLDVRDL
jgi:ATPase subunit of ABC transporter with duplicated ATPase domains